MFRTKNNFPSNGYWVHLRGDYCIAVLPYTHKNVRRTAERYLNKLGLKFTQQQGGENIYGAYDLEDGTLLSHYFDLAYIKANYTMLDKYEFVARITWNDDYGYECHEETRYFESESDLAYHQDQDPDYYGANFEIYYLDTMRPTSKFELSHPC